MLPRSKHFNILTIYIAESTVFSQYMKWFNSIKDYNFFFFFKNNIFFTENLLWSDWSDGTVWCGVLHSACVGNQISITISEFQLWRLPHLYTQ